MKKFILPIIAVTMVAGCTPHGKWTPYSVFNRGAAMELNEASRQASIAKTPQQALSYYEAVYNNNRDNEDVAIAYAKALRTSGFADRGILILQKHYDDKNASQDVILEYIKGYVAKGQFGQAEQLVKSHLQDSSKDMRDQMQEDYLAAVREARIQKTMEPARPNFETAQGDPQLHNLMGVIYDAQGHAEKAEAEFRSAMSRWDGEKGVVENNLALCLANQGKVNEAMTTISKAFVEAPDRPEIARNLEIISALHKGQSKPN